MLPRERVLAALQHQIPDRVPRFEIWIDGLLDELGQNDPVDTYANLGQDCVGNIEPLLPMVVEAGFAGIHGLDPMAGMDLAAIKKAFGQELTLIGNLDVRVLCEDDLDAVRREVDRCIAQGAPGGGYMLASCNSIFEGMNPIAVAEFFRYQKSVGFY